MENIQPQRRRPTPKLQMPLFGSTLSGGGGGSDGDSSNQITMAIAAMVVIMIGWQLYESFKSPKIQSTASGIQEMEWKGKVTKKFMGYDKPDINMFEFVDSAYVKKTVDISKDKSTFFQTLMPRDIVYKAKGSINVNIKNYTKDTTITLKFDK